jgi:hypothetical protein
MLSLAIGTAINLLMCWWCVRGYDAEKMRRNATAARRQQLPGFDQFRAELPRSWSLPVPDGWPVPERRYSASSRGLETSVDLAGPLMNNWSGWGTVVTAGWPFRCWWGGTVVWTAEFPGSTGPEQSEDLVSLVRFPPEWHRWLLITDLPIGVRTWPFLANTAVYAVVPASGWLSLIALRSRNRARAGLCARCSYNLKGLPLRAACSECGRVSPP